MTHAKRADALTRVLKGLLDAVQEAGRVPRGTLFAALMPQGCRLDQYEALERIMLKTTLVRRDGQELVWVGPTDGATCAACGERFAADELDAYDLCEKCHDDEDFRACFAGESIPDYGASDDGKVMLRRAWAGRRL